MIDFCTERLDLRQRQGNLRQLAKVDSKIDFASNDYLGLARDNEFKQEIIKSWAACIQMGVGSTGSRLLTGNSTFIENLESFIAAYHDAEAGLIFNSGYSANLGLLSTIINTRDICIYDAHIHASMRDGVRLSKARCLPCRHNDVAHLQMRLKSAQNKGNRFVCIESVYSCDGSLAPIKEITQLCLKYKALLIIDEAHSTGITGIGGCGLTVQEECQKHAFARIHTFSKAIGSFGAIVLGSSILKDYLINFCRPFIYTTSLPWSNLIAIREAYRRLPHLDESRAKLQRLIAYFQIQANSMNLPIMPSQTPIQSLLIPGNEQTRKLSSKLSQRGFDARALLSPTVQKGTERLRICLHAFNTEDEIDNLLECLKQYYICKNDPKATRSVWSTQPHKR